jgi:hypothetical protein
MRSLPLLCRCKDGTIAINFNNTFKDTFNYNNHKSEGTYLDLDFERLLEDASDEDAWFTGTPLKWYGIGEGS